MSDLFGTTSIVYEKSFPTYINFHEPSRWATVEFMNNDRGRVEIELAQDDLSHLEDMLYDNSTEYDITVTIIPRK